MVQTNILVTTGTPCEVAYPPTEPDIPIPYLIHHHHHFLVGLVLSLVFL